MIIEPIKSAKSIEALLCDSDLPVDDIFDVDSQGNPKTIFYAATKNDKPLGVIGLQNCGNTGLLRSLAVDPQYRGSGVAGSLIRYVESLATECSTKAIFLLTTDAAGFFEKHGYAVCTRENTPAGIASTAQFATLCPADAVLMRKELG